MSEHEVDPEQRDVVAGFWNERHKDAEGEAHDNYLNHPLIQGYISLRALGTVISHLEAAKHALLTHTNPGDTVLSLGCGTAGKERNLARMLPDRNFLGLDIAEEIVAMATEDAEREGLTNLTIRPGDFNDLSLDENSVQVLLGLGAIHHVENLEGLWRETRKALNPGGVILAQEYVGPNRLQWTDAQIEACNEALATLVPPEHQPHHQTVERTPVEAMIQGDPSEAVRSSEILPTCRDAGFEITAYNSAGGALLQPMLMYQIHTFNPTNWSHNRILAQLFEREDQLMQDGVLGDDFAMFVAR